MARPSLSLRALSVVMRVVASFHTVIKHHPEIRMNTSKQQIGNLTCHVVDRLARENKPELIVVLCHGYGAPGTDLVPLAGEVLGSWPRLADRVRFVFPQAPHSLDEIGVYDGRAWWHVDVAELSAKIMKGELRDIAEDVPPELPGSRDLLMGTITSLSRESGLPLSQFVLGGFSQGSIPGVGRGLAIGADGRLVIRLVGHAGRRKGMG